MSIEYLRLTKDWVCYEDTRRCFTDKPVAGQNINWRAIHGVWVDGRSKYGEARQDHESSSQCAAETYYISSEEAAHK